MDKQSLINTYLDHQMNATGDGEAEYDENATLQSVQTPGPEVLEEFKSKVRTWMEIDNTIKKLRAVIRERTHAKKDLTEYILNFMSRFNIEDLNTKEGKLRYKVSNVKAPITQQAMRVRLLENFNQEISPEELVEKVFDNRGTVEKHSLRRLKPPSSLTI